MTKLKIETKLKAADTLLQEYQVQIFCLIFFAQIFIAIKWFVTVTIRADYSKPMTPEMKNENENFEVKLEVWWTEEFHWTDLRFIVPCSQNRYPCVEPARIVRDKLESWPLIYLRAVRPMSMQLFVKMVLLVSINIAWVTRNFITSSAKQEKIMKIKNGFKNHKRFKF